MLILFYSLIQFSPSLCLSLRSHYVAKADLELLILLSQPPEWWANSW
jgi:hypothetical protein